MWEAGENTPAVGRPWPQSAVRPGLCWRQKTCVRGGPKEHEDQPPGPPWASPEREAAPDLAEPGGSASSLSQAGTLGKGSGGPLQPGSPRTLPRATQRAGGEGSLALRLAQSPRP